jgi:hypothetical protein
MGRGCRVRRARELKPKRALALEPDDEHVLQRRDEPLDG